MLTHAFPLVSLLQHSPYQIVSRYSACFPRWMLLQFVQRLFFNVSSEETTQKATAHHILWAYAQYFVQAHLLLRFVQAHLLPYGRYNLHYAHRRSSMIPATCSLNLHNLDCCADRLRFSFTADSSHSDDVFVIRIKCL